MFKIEDLVKEAKRKQKTIVFPEVSFSDRTLEAVKILQKALANPRRMCYTIKVFAEVVQW